LAQFLFVTNFLRKWYTKRPEENLLSA